MVIALAALAACVLLVAAAPAVSAAVIEVPPTPLIVRIYGTPALASSDRDSALKEAQAIFTAAGFAPTWAMCPPDATADRRCARPLERAELVVRMVTAPRQPRTLGDRTLGYSLVNVRTGAGALATIYLDRVRSLADAARSEVAVILGRAIAHEIGHLLLGTERHGRTGLMRAVWWPDTVRDSRPGDWRFTGTEAGRMRAAVVARTPGDQLARHLVPED